MFHTTADEYQFWIIFYLGIGFVVFLSEIFANLYEDFDYSSWGENQNIDIISPTPSHNYWIGCCISTFGLLISYLHDNMAYFPLVSTTEN